MDFTADTGHFGVAVAETLEPFVARVAFSYRGHVLAYADAEVAVAFIPARDTGARPRGDWRRVWFGRAG